MDCFHKLSVCLIFALVIIHGGKAALLDMCANDAACKVTAGDPNAVCTMDTAEGGDNDGQCICTGAYKNNANNDGCVEKAVSDNTCDPDDNDGTTGASAVCTAVDQNAECPAGTTTCACKSGYKEDTTNGNTCVKVLTGTCDSNDDCTGTVANSECSSSTCSCVAGYKTVNDLCSKVLGDMCNAVGDCTGTVSNSECSEQTCSCTTDYIEDSNICKKALGETCSNANECVTNAECDTTCKCSSGFINSGGLCAAESSATSAWMSASMVRTSLLIFVIKLIY